MGFGEKMAKVELKQSSAPAEEENKQGLRQLQMIELNLLKIFDQICRKNKLTYWIAYGTLLGAVRHGGFIPWDDDVDVCMPIEDYNKFIEIAESELPEYILLCYKHKGSGYNKLFAKLMDRRTTLVEKFDALCDGEFRGIYLDIFPYVKYPNISERTTYFLTKKMLSLCCRKNAYQKISVYNVVRWIALSLIFALFRAVWRILSFGNTGPYMELIPEDNGYVKRVHRDVIFPLKSLTFEGTSFPVPCNPDEYLRIMYGDYMTLPPIEKRTPHYLFFSVDKPYPHALGMEK